MNQSASKGSQPELKVLVLDDAPDDVELIRSHFHRRGFKARCQQVHNRDEFLTELRQHPPDVILSDHGLPTFDGFSALSLAREQCPDTPFLFVSGALNEAEAAKAFDGGAADYVPKDRLGTLIPAVQRALRGAREQRKYRRMLKDAEEARMFCKDVKQLLAYCLCCKKVRDEKNAWISLDLYLQHHKAATVMRTLCPECVEIYFTGLH